MKSALLQTIAPALHERLEAYYPDTDPITWSTEPDPEHGGFRLDRRSPQVRGPLPDSARHRRNSLSGFPATHRTRNRDHAISEPDRFV